MKSENGNRQAGTVTVAKNPGSCHWQIPATQDFTNDRFRCQLMGRNRRLMGFNIVTRADTVTIYSNVGHRSLANDGGNHQVPVIVYSCKVQRLTATLGEQGYSLGLGYDLLFLFATGFPGVVSQYFIHAQLRSPPLRFARPGTQHNRRLKQQHLPSTRQEILPSSMHTPWAESNSYKISKLMSFTAKRPLSGDSPSRPFCVRFNGPLPGRRQNYFFKSTYRHAATLDTKPLAKSYSGGSHTRLSSNHLQSARASRCQALRCFLIGLQRSNVMVPQSTGHQDMKWI